jgi:PAS domain S-box-containing protein
VEERDRKRFERSLAGMLRTTLEGRVLECNQAAARMFGYDSPEELLTVPATDFYYDPSEREAFLTKLKSERSLSNYEMRGRRKNGDSVWVIVNFSIVDDGSANGGTLEGTLVDITERKRAEEVVRESGETVRILLDSIPRQSMVSTCAVCAYSAIRLASNYWVMRKLRTYLVGTCTT